MPSDAGARGHEPADALAPAALAGPGALAEPGALAATGPPGEVLTWAERAAGAAQTASGGQLTAVYLHGSAVLGGWSPRSDVDLLLVAVDGIADKTVDSVACALADAGRGCPGRGLESSVVTAAAAAEPAAPWPYLVHVVTGADEPGGCRIELGTRSSGDRDLLMHYAVSRAAGLAVHGPPPREVIGEVGRQAILGYLADELDWGLEHAPEPYAVLNACRALIYLADGEIVSKIAGGLAALCRGMGPAAVIRRALAQQCGLARVQQPETDAVGFVLAAAAELRDGAASR